MSTHVPTSRLRSELGPPAGRAHLSRARRAGVLALFALPVLAAALLLPAGLTVLPAQAAELSATQMKVSVWPEYDDPRVLVINQADLDPTVQLPAEVTFNIPKGAEVGMACEVDSGGGHSCKPFQVVDMGDYQALTYKVEAQRKIFMEYYYDAFPAGNLERAFDYQYRPGFAVGTTTIEVQEPLRSSGFTLDPAPTQTSKDSQGLTYHLKDYTALPVNEPLTVRVSYTKSDSNPSVQLQEAGAAGGLPGSAGGRDNTALFVVLAVLAFGTLMMGAYKVLRPAPASSGGRGGGARRPPRPRNTQSRAEQRKTTGNTRPRSGSRAGKGSREATPDRTSDRKFCTSCGAGIRRVDNFCPECGEKQG